MSVSWGTQYTKLKTNLRLAANRLKLLQKKKTEQAIKARGEIADFLNSDKEDRARIRVENIIREDFVVEAYELLEMYCELLLARFGIIQQMKDLDDGIAEAVSSLLWVAPRIGHEITEFKAINDELTHKYGKQFAEAARMNQLPEPSRVSTKLVQKLSVSAPNKLLVEKYLITIAQSGNIPFTPDPKVMRDDDDEIARAERNLINFMNEEQYGWSVKSDDANSVQGGPTNVGNTFNGGGGRGGFPQATQGPPPEYAPPPPPPNYISPQQQGPGANSNVYPTQNQNTAMPYISSHGQTNFGVQPMPNALPEKQSIDQHIYETPPYMHKPHPTQPGSESDNEFLLPKFPDPPKEVPNTLGRGGGSGFPRTGGDDGPNMMGNGNQNADLDFDALARRFEELKKKL